MPPCPSPCTQMPNALGPPSIFRAAAAFGSMRKLSIPRRTGNAAPRSSAGEQEDNCSNYRGQRNVSEQSPEQAKW